MITVGSKVYKRTGSPLAAVVSIDHNTRTAVIEYQYTVGKKRAGQKETVGLERLTEVADA